MKKALLILLAILPLWVNAQTLGSSVPQSQPIDLKIEHNSEAVAKSRGTWHLGTGILCNFTGALVGIGMVHYTNKPVNPTPEYLQQIEQASGNPARELKIKDEYYSKMQDYAKDLDTYQSRRQKYKIIGASLFTVGVAFDLAAGYKEYKCRKLGFN